MKKTKTANVHGFVGEGATVSDAKRDAESLAENARSVAYKRYADQLVSLLREAR